MAKGGSSDGLSEEERDAVKARAKEVREQQKAGKNREAGTKAVLDAIAELPPDDRVIAQGLHGVVERIAPLLVPKTYYGMPAYADDGGKVVVFVQPSAKFGTRYSTIGFQDRAHLDDGDIWPTAFAVAAWSPTVEKSIAELVERAVS